MRRLRPHLTYANVMVTLLAFGALTGGVAYAANTVFSSDIVDGQVKTADIGNDQIRSADVRDETLPNGGLSGPDIKEETLDVVQGRGTLLSNRIVQVPTHSAPLLDIPGLGELGAGCDHGEADISYLNDTFDSTVDAWLTGFDFLPPLAPGGDRTPVASSNGPTSATLTLGLGDDPGPRRIAVIHASVVKRSVGNAPCIFQAQGTLWTSD